MWWDATSPVSTKGCDPQIDLARAMVVALAERLAVSDVSPNGRPGALVVARALANYDIGRGQHHRTPCSLGSGVQREC